MQVKQEFNFHEFYLNVKQYLNNGIPNVHLSKGCIGELCVFEEDNGKGTALIHLWQSEFNDFLGLRNEFKRLGASKIHIYETMDDESVSICNGVDADGLGRSITVEFAIEQNCEAFRTARSKAYRDIWDMVYRVARTEKNNDKNHKGENALHLVNLILRATRKSINENGVNIDDVISMIEKTVDIYLQDRTFPTLSELRRFELKKDADDKAMWITEYKKTLAELSCYATHTYEKKKYFSTPLQVWKAYYRAQRLCHVGCEDARALFHSINDETADKYFSKMLDCVVEITHPMVSISKSAIRRSALLATRSKQAIASYAAGSFDEDEIPF
ncbi:hypothetical protein [Moritella sp.]|uniref:hypothetical protein n=1 Tax=Moritella sp. TaxID=78556 RepID=UPI0025E8F020|nr:hypothetical protein [Moritella sp.]MCJ8348281.1 hypothetical protein [Moritella sp.]